MYKNQKRITKYTNEDGAFMVRRIMDVDGDRVRLVNEGWVDKAQCSVPLNIDDFIIINSSKVRVTSVAFTSDGFSVRSFDSFTYDDNGRIDTIPYECETELSYDYISSEDESLNDSSTVSEVCSFLKSVHYSYTPKVISDMVEKAFNAKAKLREKFRKSEFWNEELQAIIIKDFRFSVSPDYQEVKNRVIDILSEVRHLSNSFDNVYYLCRDVVPNMLYKNSVYLNDSYAEQFERYASGFKYHPGTKVTRFLRSVMDTIEVSKYYNDYEKQFALLSDAASPSEKRRTLVLSLNIMDFLTMSNGNSWNSCHNIANRGCYHGGTLSYALDETTAILYTLDADVDTSKHIWSIPKINRQLFMFGDNVVVESRLYPEPSEGVNTAQLALREVHHKFIKKFYSEIMNKNFLESKRPYTTISERVVSKGLHYRDYEYEKYHCGCMLADTDSGDEKIVIGAESPDIVTGSKNCYHDSLTRSGINKINEYPLSYGNIETDSVITDVDYVVEYNGAIYNQSDCVWCDTEDLYCPESIAIEIWDYYYTPEYVEENFVRCDRCGDWERREEVIYVGDDCYCRDCRDSYLARCEHCGEWCVEDDMHCVDGEYICDDCYEETQVCSVCGERHFACDFADGSTVCNECAENADNKTSDIVIPETGVIKVANISETKMVLIAAKNKGLHWINGKEACDSETVDVIRRTFMCPNITGVGLVFSDGTLSYTPEATELGMEIPEKFGEVIDFKNLSTVTVESEA